MEIYVTPRGCTFVKYYSSSLFKAYSKRTGHVIELIGTFQFKDVSDGNNALPLPRLILQ
jgi:hypothetical protein